MSWFLFVPVPISLLVPPVSGFSDDTGWVGVKGSDPRVQARWREKKRRRKENHRIYGLGDRNRETEESTTSDTGNQRQKEKKKRPAFVGRLFELNQKREDVTKKKKVKEILINERKKVHWISRGELDFILRGINFARTDKAKQGIK